MPSLNNGMDGLPNRLSLSERRNKCRARLSRIGKQILQKAAKETEITGTFWSAAVFRRFPLCSRLNREPKSIVATC